MALTSNQDWVERARAVMPGGVASPVRAYQAVKSDPVPIQHAEGARVWDADGNAYIDLVSAYGAIVLGHAHPAVVEACEQAARSGLNTGTPNPPGIRLAERVTGSHAAMDWVRFVNSGTEAVMSALRLARGATGRSGIVTFTGCYHGHWDPLLVEAGSGVSVYGAGQSEGVPEGMIQDTAVLPLDDEEVLDAFFDEHGEAMAGAVIEPIVANSGLLPQRKAFLQRLEERCRESGTLLVFDEIVTGFRYGPGGIAGALGIEPDLVTLGKTLGGGLPIGAYGGREELRGLVSPEGKVYQAGTASANQITMEAGNAVLDTLDDEGTGRLDEAASRLSREGTKALSPIGARIRHHGPLAWLTFAPEPLPRQAGTLTEEHREAYGRFHRHALEAGLHVPPSPVECLFPTLAFDEGVLDEVVQRLSDAALRMEGSL